MNSAKITRLTRVTISALAFFCVITSQAQAGTATSINGLYVTGIDGTDTGTRDDHWAMSAGGYAYVVSNTNVNTNGWLANVGSSKWISYANNGSTGLGSGAYTYTLSFTIAGNPQTQGEPVSNVSVYMTLAVDDSAVVTVNGGNGVSTTGTGQWSRTQNLTLSNGFVIGNNTITITVSNSGSGPSGVMVTSISGVVPEVGTWVPLAIAFGLFAWARFRPRKHTLPAAV